MWSNDFPHGNSTWPKSREVVARDLGTLPAKLRAKFSARNRRQGLQYPDPDTGPITGVSLWFCRQIHLQGLGGIATFSIRSKTNG